MNRLQRIIATYVSLAWLVFLLVIVGVALWAQTEIFSIHTRSSLSTSEIENLIKSDPIKATILLWVAFSIAYLFLIRLFGLSLYKLIIGITNVSKDDKETRTFAGYVTVAVAAGLTVMTVLFVVDYVGHSELSERKIREAESGKKEEPPAAPQPTISLNIFNEANGHRKSALGTSAVAQKSIPHRSVAKLQHDISNRFVAWPGKMGEHLGTFGDFFGGVLNPLLTFVTLIALAITILMQRIQLNEARGQAKRASAHEQTLAFETTFFNMLSLHAENVKNLTFDPAIIESGAPKKLSLFKRIVYLGVGAPKVGEPVYGRAVFSEVLRSTQRGATEDRPQRDIYEYLQKEHNDVLGHYFRHLYQILDHVDLFKIDGKIVPYHERKRYADILRAQLSSHELSVLNLNCLKGMVDEGKFQDKLIDYEFLEHAPITIREDKNRLGAKGIDYSSEKLLFEYFDAVQADQENSNKLYWASGAFGRNNVVREFLSRQTSSEWKWDYPTANTRRKPERPTVPNENQI